MRSYLAMFDIKNDKSWSILHKQFIINKNTNTEIHGAFLRDVWFNYQIQKEDICDIHFMLLFSDKSVDTILEDIKRLDNEFPSIYDNPKNTCGIFKNFVLKYDLLEKTRKLLKKHGDSQEINLYDSTNNILSFQLILCEEKCYLTLPSFKYTKNWSVY